MQKPDEQRHPRLRRKGSGEGYKSCGARTKAGGRCTQPAGFGTDHPGFGQCKYHGGDNVVGDAIAAREEVAAVSKILRLSGLERCNPQDALMEELARAAGAVRYFDDIVAKIEPNQLLFPQSQIQIDMWNEQRTMLARTAALALRAGIEERAVRVQEVQAQAMVGALLAVLSKLDLSPEQVATAKVEMASKLRELSAAS